MRRYPDASRYSSCVVCSLFLLTAVSGITLMSVSSQPAANLWRAQMSAIRRATGQPQLRSVEPITPLPADMAVDGEMCQWLPASAATSLSGVLAAPLQTGHEPSTDPKDVGNADRAPVRRIRDTYPTYSAVAVNLKTNEVFLQDENLFGIKVFDRTMNTPASAAFSEPKRSIAGGGVTKL
jgi:hypothetical protein